MELRVNDISYNIWRKKKYFVIANKMGLPSSGVEKSAFDSVKNDVTSMKPTVSSLLTWKQSMDTPGAAQAAAMTTENYNQLAQAITSNSTFNDKVATAVAGKNELGTSLAPKLLGNDAFKQSVQDTLGKNTSFQQAMATTLSSDQYKVNFKGDRGADGNIGDKGALKSNLYDKGLTLWCEDGDECKIPTGKKGIDTSIGQGGDQGRIGFKRWSQNPAALDIVGATGTGNIRWVKLWDAINAPIYTTDGFGLYDTKNPEWSSIVQGNNIRSKEGIIGIVDRANNGFVAFMDNYGNGRVKAARIEIGDWVIYQNPDGSLAFSRGGDKMKIVQWGDVWTAGGTWVNKHKHKYDQCQGCVNKNIDTSDAI